MTCLLHAKGCDTLAIVCSVTSATEESRRSNLSLMFGNPTSLRPENLFVDYRELLTAFVNGIS